MNYDELLAPAAKAMRPSGIRKFFDLAADMPHCISLGVGEPEMLSYTVPHDGIERALIRLPKISDTPDKYPRRFKKIQTAPL